MIFTKTRALSAIVFSFTLFAMPALALSQKDFMTLCLKGDVLQVAEALKDEGVSAKKADAKGVTPLMMAAQAKGRAADPGKIELLVGAGGNVNAKNKDNMRVLMIAAQSTTNPEVITALVRAGADLDERSAKGFTPLAFAAAENSNPEIVNALADLGADVNATENTGSTPFLLAARNGNAYAVLEALLEDGADPAIPNSSKKTPLSFIESNKKYTSQQIAALKERIQQGKALQPMSSKRFAQLCSRGVESRVREYLEARTDPNAAYNGMTPLMYAAHNNTNAGVISVLMKWGARENARDDRGRTALIHAAQYSKNPQVLTELLTQGARVDYRDIEGKNALDYAQTNPVYTAENLLLLSSIVESVDEAEERGARIEVERRKATQTETNIGPRITSLYQKISDDQKEILRLTTLSADLQKKNEQMSAALEAAQTRKSSEKTQFEQQQALIAQLNASLKTLQDEQSKDQEISRASLEKLAVLWRSEMQKNLNLVEAHTLSEQELKKQIDELEAKYRNAQEQIASFEDEKKLLQAQYKKEKDQAEAGFQSEIDRLNEVHRAEVDDLNVQLQAAVERERFSQQYMSVAAAQHRQEIVDLKSAQARALEEASIELDQQTAKLKKEHENELQDARIRADAEHAVALKNTIEQLNRQHNDELLQEKSQHALALVDKQKEFDSLLESRLADLGRQKDEERQKNANDLERENSTLKVQFREALEALYAIRKQERESYSRQVEELLQSKKQVLEECESLKAQIRVQEEKSQSLLRQKLAEQETELRRAFEVEKARMETQHRQELLDLTAKLEAQHTEEINKLKDEQQRNLNETVSQLQSESDNTQAQLRMNLEDALASAAEQNRARRDENAEATRAGIAQGHQEARQLLESAYAQSLRQAELRYEKQLKEAQRKQKIESDAAIEVLNARHRQEMEEASAQAQTALHNALAAQSAENEQKNKLLRAELETQWNEREKELTSRYDEKVEQIRLFYAQDNANLSAALKKEYESRTEVLLAQNNAQHADEIRKLEAIQEGALRSLEERYRTQKEKL